MKLLHPMACDFMVYKDNKNWPKTCFSSMWNQLRDPEPHLSSYRSSCHHPSQYFFEALPMPVFSLYPPSAFDHTFFLSMICCFQSSSRHAVQAGISEPKIISLYLMIVPLMASSSSFYVFVQF